MKTLLLALVLCVSLISCSKKEVAVKSSKDLYKDVLHEIFEISYVSSDEIFSDMLCNINIKDAERNADTLLAKIHKKEKENRNLVRKEKEAKILLLQAKQDSLLKNDTILISRGIRKTDDINDIEIKFKYYDSINRATKPVTTAKNDDDDDLVFFIIMNSFLN